LAKAAMAVVEAQLCLAGVEKGGFLLEPGMGGLIIGG